MLHLVRRVNIRQNTGLNDVRRQAVAVERAAACLQLDGNAAQRILALGDGVDGEDLKGMLHRLHDLIDGIESRVHRAVAQADLFKALLAPLEADGRRGRRKVAGMDGEPIELVAVFDRLGPVAGG